MQSRTPRKGGAEPAARSPLVLALAAAALSAARNIQTQTRYALDHGEPLCEPCSCRADVGSMRCTCAVELPMTAAWRRRAAGRHARGEPVGVLPRRRCRLCRSGDHDLVPTYEVEITLAGSDGVRVVRMPEFNRRNRRHEARRAERAVGYPAGTSEAQRRAAGIG